MEVSGEKSAHVSRLSAAERLMNLLLALYHTAGLSKSDIRRQVAGYQNAEPGPAFDRMFERDKETLRGLGVPIVVDGTSGHYADIRYRVDHDSYSLPHLDFTEDEVAALAAAATLWSDGALAEGSERALAKLAVAGVSAPFAPPVGGFAVVPRLPDPPPVLESLLSAVNERHRVRFQYRSAHSGQVRERQLEPAQIIARDGVWYLVGRERGHGESRTFRLSRILGEVRVERERGPSFAPPEPPAPEVASPRSARLRIRRDRAPALRARGRGAGEEVEIPFTSLTHFADEVAAYADAVVVLDPPDLRAAVLDRLAAVIALAEDG